GFPSLSGPRTPTSSPDFTAAVPSHDFKSASRHPGRSRNPALIRELMVEKLTCNDLKTCGYRNVAETLREQIRAGAIAIGSLLPTERELVDGFGVSRSTVRRALQELVGSGWAESIPNRGVSARMGHTEARRQVVGFVDDAEAVVPDLFFALNARLQCEGLVLTHVDSRFLGTEGALEYCLEHRLAGAVVWSKTINPDRNRLSRVLRSMPIVAVDHALRNIDTDLVTCDVFEGAKTAVRHLAALGYRRIGIVGMLDSLDTTQERFGGYLEGMFEVGLQPQPRDFIFTRTSGTCVPDTAAIERRLTEPDAPDAIFVMQDHCMGDVITAATRVGVSIPESLAIVTMGSDDPYDVLPETGATTVAFDWAQMADFLFDRVCCRLADPAARTVRVVVPAQIVVRGSCGAPRELWSNPSPLHDSLAPSAITGAASQTPGSGARANIHPYRANGGTPQPLSKPTT
ncbi:MAG: GntR family transcriptional regulator, partial [Fimbriimonas sp.]|nr:GntR family transcriptional regulator [Fimbriimonas sp.]